MGVLLSPPPLPAPIGSVLVRERIFRKPPFRSCHASTIVQTKAGTLIAAWFGGTKEGNPDVSIYSSRWSDDASAGWSRPRKIADGRVPGSERLACYNPVLFQPKSGPLLFFYQIGLKTAEWHTYVKTSTDDGRTWSVPRRLPQDFVGPVKDKPYELPGGGLLYGASEETEGWQVHFERSDDAARNWTRTTSVNDPATIEAIQPTFLPERGSRIRAIGRTKQGRIFATDSSDRGATWGPMRLLDVPNPNSGIDALQLRDGRYLLVYNPTKKGRSPLSVAISSDAEHWTRALDLETSPGEYSYPAVIQSADGHVHITYTWRRKTIEHVVLDPSKL